MPSPPRLGRVLVAGEAVGSICAVIQDKFLQARSMFNATVQTQQLLSAHPSTLPQAAPRAVDHTECKDVFVEVFAMAEP